MADKIMEVKVSLVNKTTAEWEAIASTAIPHNGCACIEWIDDKGTAKVKYGNGTSTYADLPYAGLTKKEIEDLVATKAESLIIEESTDSDYAKVYTFKQGEAIIGTVNIPLDMVVSSGEILTDPDAEHVGTFLVLTIANDAQDKVYINLGEMLKAYTVEENATMVQLAISDTNVISATIVDASITKAKLATDVTDILDKAITTDDALTLNCTL